LSAFSVYAQPENTHHNLTQTSCNRTSTTTGILRTLGLPDAHEVMANIQSLPNELLEDVLGIACGDQPPTSHCQQLQLSQVNRRLRELAINDARLWSHITFTSSVEWIEILLQRSGNHGLIVDLAEHHPSTRNSYLSCSCPDMVSRALVHKDRWREVHMGTRFNNDSGFRRNLAHEELHLAVPPSSYFPRRLYHLLPLREPMSVVEDALIGASEMLRRRLFRIS
jgi:hypothetical protein